MPKLEVHNASHLQDGELGPAAIAIGNFDGVHLAHRVICEQLVDKAEELGVLPMVYTFQPHPRKVLQGPQAVCVLTTFEKKCDLLADLGVKVVVWSEFTREFSEQSPSEFVSRILVEKLRARHLFVGHDAHFARDRSGDFNTLAEMGERHGFGVSRTEAVMHDGLIVSSTQVRKLIESGEMRRANEFLGWQFSIPGTVVRGDRRGHTIGFPTANLKTEVEVFPDRGVYATLCEIHGRTIPGITNVGKNPTFNPEIDMVPLRIETHLFDFTGDLYGEEIEVTFLERIRGEQRFAGVDELKAQIQQDIHTARKIHEMEARA